MTQSNEYCDLSWANFAKIRLKNSHDSGDVWTQVLLVELEHWAEEATFGFGQQVYCIIKKRMYLPQYFLDLNNSFCRWRRNSFSMHLTHYSPYSDAAHGVITVRNIANIVILWAFRSHGHICYFMIKLIPGKPLESWRAAVETQFRPRPLA